MHHNFAASFVNRTMHYSGVGPKILIEQIKFDICI